MAETFFNHVVLGGTFDHLHKGHKALIDKAFAVGKKVTIGLTSEKLTKNKFLSQTIESYIERYKALKNYLSLKKFSDRCKILKIDDIFGSTLTDETIEAIVVSKNTLSGAQLINRERGKRKLPFLKIIIVPDVLGEDGELITSEKIRLGVIDREGGSYRLAVGRRLILPDHLRESLRKPLGEV
ncbi:MAG: pantetheine-phosphate adenylyltransferase, partial [Microgenomates group bacterium]